MIKFLLRFLFTILIVLTLSIIVLSYFGLETNRFDYLIKNKVNSVNNNLKLDFNKTKIYLKVSELKLLVKLQNPKIIVKSNEIDLKKLELSLSLKSFYTSDFLLERANVSFQRNDIKDLTKVTNIFLPRIINKQLKKIFYKGNLEGEFIIPFKSDGTIREDYTFYGKINEAILNLPNDYKVENLTAAISYGETSKLGNDGLRIIIEKGKIYNLKFLESIIDIKFQNKKKLIKSTIHTQGNLNSTEIKKILSILSIKTQYPENIDLTSDLKSTFEFDIDEKFKINNKSYKIKGDINKLKFKSKEKEFIKDYLPSFNPNIVIKNSKIDLSSMANKQKLEMIGEIKFSDNFEKLKLIYVFNKKNKKHNINVASTLNASSINLSKLNYKKKIGKASKINLKADLIFNKYFLIESLNYNDDKSEIILDKIKLNNSFQIIDFNELKVKTYLNNIKNNDFLIKKADQITIKGEVFDSQSLLKSLFKRDDRKVFSKKFKSEVKINLKKVITGTNDDVEDLGVVASINKGSYNKLILKGSFSENEIIEMSIYQADENQKTLQVISDRARPFVKHFDFIEGFEGGRLEYESNLINKKSHSNLLITDFKVSKVPALAQLLTLASLQGIADTLSGEGIRFDSFEMKTLSENNVVNIEDALAMGPAVSILLDGYIDKDKIVSLRGTLVPATKLNAIIAKIPLVGNILVGKKIGEGIVGVSFKMKGPPKKIKTTVNPIKTLTPRFIVRAVENMKKKKKKIK